ncbi:hypothetical protein DFR37_101248 [Eoetvoesiella caeni]|uniref:Uncharacterized protein n=1 Tax=Eoetvoesiella caeni TaxID=645616 RepID=A0A366HJN2_9BURK|nr:hypothetical protein DFR37_101248 [Eoetvoesiella caeni]
MKKSFFMLVFWAALIAFFAWDWAASAPVNHRLEPPLIAAGSGQAPSGGHCASTF